MLKIIPANQSHHLSADVSSLITSRGNAGLGQIVNSVKSGFHFFLLLLLHFKPAKCLVPSSPFSHPSVFPLYYFMYSDPRPAHTVDHSPLPFEPTYPNLPVQGLVLSACSFCRYQVVQIT